MTREETKKCIEVMQAYVDGEEIQSRWKGANEGDWRSEEEPHWYWNTHDYRIKPQPMKVTEEEKEIIETVPFLWLKNMKTGQITWAEKQTAHELKTKHYILNSETMEWEDWSEE